jgi:hypothetical protein
MSSREPSGWQRPSAINVGVIAGAAGGAAALMLLAALLFLWRRRRRSHGLAGHAEQRRGPDEGGAATIPPAAAIEAGNPTAPPFLPSGAVCGEPRPPPFHAETAAFVGFVESSGAAHAADATSGYVEHAPTAQSDGDARAV